MSNPNNSHSGIKDTPLNLAFGSDIVIPVKIGINSLRVTHFSYEQNEANLRANLDLLEEIKEGASVKVAVRQRRVTQYYNKQVKTKAFEEGNLVLRNCRASRPAEEQRKLLPTWEGPYLVSFVIGKWAYRLQTIEGKDIPNSWNAKHLKKYYY